MAGEEYETAATDVIACLLLGRSQELLFGDGWKFKVSSQP
jgi:hypothetical protein